VGRFPILQKQVHHRSNRYSNAPMPYMQRLTGYGIALHGGALPGYPASHGCIRLPHAFARRLYGMTGPGTRVTVTRARPRSVAAAARLA
jgi:lipoprotein-anchoring transpeptidase ErfK/SrfK